MRDDDGNKYLGETYFKINSIWKKTKTVYNPAVHINNYVSNFTLYYGAGGAWKQLKKVHNDGTAGQIMAFEKGTLKWENLDPDIQAMYKDGVFGRDYLVTYFIIFPENSNSRLKQLAFAPSEGAP